MLTSPCTAGAYDHLTPDEEKAALYATVKGFLHAEEECVEVATRLCLLIRKRRFMLHASAPTTSKPTSGQPASSQQSTSSPSLSSPPSQLRCQALCELSPHISVRELWRSILVRVDGMYAVAEQLLPEYDTRASNHPWRAFVNQSLLAASALAMICTCCCSKLACPDMLCLPCRACHADGTSSPPHAGTRLS